MGSSAVERMITGHLVAGSIPVPSFLFEPQTDADAKDSWSAADCWSSDMWYRWQEWRKASNTKSETKEDAKKKADSN
jgi:hypothetical protein